MSAKMESAKERSGCGLKSTLPNKIHKRPQRRGQVVAAGVVKEGAAEVLGPGFEDGDEFAAVEVRLQPVFEQVDDAEAVDGGLDGEVEGGGLTNL
jgi:hypothetical protein